MGSLLVFIGAGIVASYYGVWLPGIILLAVCVLLLVATINLLLPQRILTGNKQQNTNTSQEPCEHASQDIRKVMHTHGHARQADQHRPNP
jgi:uncharacterized membrane protein